MTIYVPGKVVLKKESVAADSYYGNVSLLLHGDGTNGSTTIVDNSPSPKTVTANGNAQISTAQSKFGGASIAFDGNGDYLECSTRILIAQSDDFTIETWSYQLNLSADYVLVSDSATNVQIFRLNFGTPGRVECGIYGSGYPGILFFAIALSPSTWHHLAFSRSGGTIRLFVDGQEVGTSTAVLPDFYIDTVGSFSGSSLFTNGYIDDLRITKGVARYTANFTPPTAPFPEVLG